MNHRLLFPLALCFALPATASVVPRLPDIDVTLTGTTDDLLLTWTTNPGCRYTVDLTYDLLAGWTDAGIDEPGDGTPLHYHFSTTTDRMFFRVWETQSFFIAPLVDNPRRDAATGRELLRMEDGVRLAFGLDELVALPDRIVVYQRPAGTHAWAPVGTIKDFMERGGVRCVRGSAVWLPEAPGEYDLRAVALDAAGTVLAVGTRWIDIQPNQPPVIEITGGLPTISAEIVWPAFDCMVSDPEGDPIRRVELYDNGVRVSNDTLEPWGDGSHISWSDAFYRGVHHLTARAYDSYGAVGETTVPWVVEVTDGPSRPEITITAPPDGHVLAQGEPLVIEVDAPPRTEDEIPDLDTPNGQQVLGPVSPATPGSPLVFEASETLKWRPGPHRIQVWRQVEASDHSYGLWSYWRFLEVEVTSPTATALGQSLAAAIVGDGVTVEPASVKFAGVEVSSAPFSGGLAAGLQMDAGIVLTTGSAGLWNFGDQSKGTWEGRDPAYENPWWIEPGDARLEARFTPEPTGDAVVLEFDATCEHGQLELEYQFGSEEYLDFVGDFNDLFVITIDGVPISLLPDGSDIVKVETVHALTEDFLPAVNEHLFLDNECDILPTVAPENRSYRVEYDGLTVRLKAHAFVTAGQTHRVRIAIADVNDDNLDSAIFLGQGSLRTVPAIP